MTESRTTVTPVIANATGHLGMLAAAVARPDRPFQRVMGAFDLSVAFSGRTVISGITHAFGRGEVSAIIGPSGCGKTTFLRALNRMHDFTPGARVSGRVEVAGVDLYDETVDPIAARRHIGMVFQRPNPFPTMSVAENVFSGVRFTGRRNAKAQRSRVVEECLKRAALWDEVKDRLDRPGSSLSGGQQQRLCIARALAMDPSVILMDEPCSALDPIATLKIEELILQLRSELTMIVVTHNLQQAARISDSVVFMLGGADGVGTVVESGRAIDVFSRPSDQRTEAYLTGRMG